MIRVLSGATLLGGIDTPEGNRRRVTEKMLYAARQKIYQKEEEAPANLSEVRTFNAIDLRSRHHD
eukprot:9897994-Prorocentrum_lima.AAC.1